MTPFCTMFPNSSALPQDLYDLIIDDLCDDNPSLKACSLVASSWRPPSQRHLHQTMVFWSGLPLPIRRNVLSNPHSTSTSTSSSEKTRLLLETSSHLLQYVRTIIIRGDRFRSSVICRGPTYLPGAWCTPDPSLVVLLRKISTLAPSSLSSLELHDLRWTGIDADLRHALISLLIGDTIKNVKLHSCVVPHFVPWMRFVGVQTRAFKLDVVDIIDDATSECDCDTSIEDNLPISPAQKLTDLDITSFDSDLAKWILHPSENSDILRYPASSGTALSWARSWRATITTLSLDSPYDFEGLFEVAQACSRLVTIQINFHPTADLVDTLPLNQLMRIPTLESLHILLEDHHFFRTTSEFITLFAALAPLPIASNHTPSLAKSKAIFIDVMSNERWHSMNECSFRKSLVQIGELDKILAGIPNVEVSLRVPIFEFWDEQCESGPEQLEMLSMRIHDGLEALRLVVY